MGTGKPSTAQRAASPEAEPPPYPLSAEDAAAWIAKLRVADRACCCPAMPAIVALLPPCPGRSEPVEIFLCGHHGRASRKGLAAAAARIYQLP